MEKSNYVIKIVLLIISLIKNCKINLLSKFVCLCINHCPLWTWVRKKDFDCNYIMQIPGENTQIIVFCPINIVKWDCSGDTFHLLSQTLTLSMWSQHHMGHNWIQMRSSRTWILDALWPLRSSTCAATPAFCTCYPDNSPVTIRCDRGKRRFCCLSDLV